MSRPFDEPAFPCEEPPENTLLYTGMSVGDVFAAVALHSLLRVSPQSRPADLAARATDIAREMVKLRTPQTQTKKDNE